MMVRTFLFLPCDPATSPAAEFTNQKKTGEIALIVFNAGFDDAARILARGLASGDSRGIFQPTRNHMLHAARGVVERDCLDFRMPAKKVAALVERYRMRQCAPERPEPHSRHGDYIVHDSQQVFALNENSSRQHKVGMLR